MIFNIIISFVNYNSNYLMHCALCIDNKGKYDGYHTIYMGDEGVIFFKVWRDNVLVRYDLYNSFSSYGGEFSTNIYYVIHGMLDFGNITCPCPRCYNPPSEFDEYFFAACRDLRENLGISLESYGCDCFNHSDDDDDDDDDDDEYDDDEC